MWSVRRNWWCCSCAALTLGCASSQPSPNVPKSHWLPGYVLGIWGSGEFDARDDCPQTGVRDVSIGTSGSTLLVSLATLGIYTPREVEVHCQPHP